MISAEHTSWSSSLKLSQLRAASLLLNQTLYSMQSFSWINHSNGTQTLLHNAYTNFIRTSDCSREICWLCSSADTFSNRHYMLSETAIFVQVKNFDLGATGKILVHGTCRFNNAWCVCFTSTTLVISETENLWIYWLSLSDNYILSLSATTLLHMLAGGWVGYVNVIGWKEVATKLLDKKITFHIKH